MLTLHKLKIFLKLSFGNYEEGNAFKIFLRPQGQAYTLKTVYR